MPLLGIVILLLWGLTVSPDVVGLVLLIGGIVTIAALINSAFRFTGGGN